MIDDDAQLPVDIERGAKGGPGFKTSIITLASGAEERNQEWAAARGEWDIGYGIRNRADLQAVLNFFYARRGRARSFRFKDWLDFSATAEPMGDVEGHTDQRQLQKSYDTVNPYIRNVVLPISASLIVYVDNFALDPGDFTLGDDGVVTFAGGDPGINVKATFEFDVPVRFDIDALPITLNTLNEGEIEGITLIELR